MKQNLVINATAVAVLACLQAPTVNALEFSGKAALGAVYTDNAFQTSTNEENELIVGVGLQGDLRESTGPFTSKVSASVNGNHYTQDTFSDEAIFNMDGAANWEISRERVNLQIQDYYKQSKINSLGTVTPNNLQDTNVFSIGPVIKLPLSGRHLIALEPTFRDFYYQESDTDNQKLALKADWLYALFRTLDVGAGVDISKTEYDNDTLNDNYTITNPYFILKGKRAKFDYRLNLGATDIDRDRLKDENGSTADLFVTYRQSGHSSLSLRLATLLTDADQNHFNSLRNIEYGDFANEAVTSDVLRNKIMRLQYQLTGDIITSQAWIELRDLDYKVDNALDRKVRDFGVDLSYNLNSLTTVSFRVARNEKDIQQPSRTDKETILGIGASYRLSRQLQTAMDLFSRRADSSSSGPDFDDNRVSLNLIYSFGRVR